MKNEDVIVLFREIYALSGFSSKLHLCAKNDCTQFNNKRYSILTRKTSTKIHCDWFSRLLSGKSSSYTYSPSNTQKLMFSFFGDQLMMMGVQTSENAAQHIHVPSRPKTYFLLIFTTYNFVVLEKNKLLLSNFYWKKPLPSRQINKLKGILINTNGWPDQCPKMKHSKLRNKGEVVENRCLGRSFIRPPVCPFILLLCLRVFSGRACTSCPLFFRLLSLGLARLKPNNRHVRKQCKELL